MTSRTVRLGRPLLRAPLKAPLKALLGAALMACPLVASSAGAQAIRLPETSTLDLPNGLRVVLAEQHALPIIEARLWIPAGASTEPAGREGITTFTAELLNQGTTTRSAQDIARELDQMGASFESQAGRDQLQVSLTVLARHRKPALALLADCVLHSTFAEAEVERVRTRLLADLQQMAEDPGALAEIALWRTRFADDPYGRRIQGTQSSLMAINAGELKAYHHERLVPHGSVLALVGDFKTAQMKKELKGLFGGWKGGSAAGAATPPVTSAPGVRVILVHKPELTQTQIRLGFPGLKFGHPDEPALIAAAAVLGGGFTSRLMEAIRVERSLSYSASCRLVQGGRSGLLRVATFTKTPTTRETVDVALAEVHRFRDEGPTAEELEKSVNYLSGNVARSLQAPGEIAQSLASVAFYHLPEDYVARRIERIRAVTVEDVRRVAASYFGKDDMALVLVGDASAVRDGLNGLGSIEDLEFETLLK
jgi:zinc protease